MAYSALAAVMAASTTYSAYSGNRADQQARSAQRQAQREADAQANATEQANNRANQKRPDSAGALSAAMQAGKSGVSGTMLTGPSGVDLSALQLGRNTLLGG